ncbi:MAG TPA: hypothetical protein VGB64_07235 [Actinomycetota bacterium]
MEFALPTAVASLALLIVLALHWRHRAREIVTPQHAIAGRPVTVVLDIADADPADASVRRLVNEAARRATAQSRDAGEIVVLSRTGRLLGRVAGNKPMPPPASNPPASFRRPPASRRSAEAAAGLGSHRGPTTASFDPRERPAFRMPVAQAFDLPVTVRGRIRDATDPVELVRAILDAAGLSAVRNGDAIRCGDQMLIVMPERVDTMMHDALNQAYLAFRETGAPHGIVIGFGPWDPIDVRRREILAPELRHAGPDAIQRMADAVSLGADPLAFIVAPPVLAAPIAPTSDQRRAG